VKHRPVRPAESEVVDSDGAAFVEPLALPAQQHVDGVGREIDDAPAVADLHRRFSRLVW
jgi:hypothetical protein